MWLTNESRQLRLDFAALYRNWNLAVLFATTVQFDLGGNHKRKSISTTARVFVQIARTNGAEKLFLSSG